MWRRLVPVIAAVACAAVLVAAGAVLWPGLLPSSSAPASAPGSTGGGGPSSGSPADDASPGRNATPPSGGSTPPTNSTPPANGTFANLTLVLRVPQTSFRTGEPVGYAMTLTNTGNTTQTVARTGCNPWLLVTNATGAIVYSLAGLMCPMVVSYVTLAPGQSLSVNGNWSQVDSVTGQQVPAGLYTLSARWDSAWDELESNAVTITILGS